MKSEKKRQIESEEESPRCVVQTTKLYIYTQQILKHIPEADVQLALDAYHQIRKLKRLSGIPKFPKREIRTILRALTRTRHSGFINKDEYNSLYLDIFMRLHNCKASKGYYIKEMLKHEKGNYKDFARDILCFSLAYMLRNSKLTSAARVDLVEGFFSEHNISVETKYFKRRRNELDSNTFYDTFLWNLKLLGFMHDQVRISADFNDQDRMEVIFDGDNQFAGLIKCLGAEVGQVAYIF